MAVLSKNKKAYFDYEIINKRSAGLVLQGHEAKALREHSVSLKESLIHMSAGELFLVNLHIPKYSKASQTQLGNFDPTRTRKLLLHKREIARISAQKDQGGLRLIPLGLHRGFKNFVKLELGIGKKKKKADKKRLIRERDIDRSAQKAIKNYL